VKKIDTCFRIGGSFVIYNPTVTEDYLSLSSFMWVYL